MLSSMVSSPMRTRSTLSSSSAAPTATRPAPQGSGPDPPGGGRTAVMRDAVRGRGGSSLRSGHLVGTLAHGQRPRDVVRECDGLAEADVVLAQRMPLPVVGEEDAAQVVMALEDDAHEVER